MTDDFESHRKSPLDGLAPGRDDEPMERPGAIGAAGTIRLLMLALFVWALVLAVGAYLFNHNPWRFVTVMGCMGAFLAFWTTMLAHRAGWRVAWPKTSAIALVLVLACLAGAMVWMRRMAFDPQLAAEPLRALLWTAGIAGSALFIAQAGHLVLWWRLYGGTR